MSRSASALTLPFERNTNEPSWYHGRPASVPRCTAHISVDNNRDLAADLVGMAVSAARLPRLDGNDAFLAKDLGRHKVAFVHPITTAETRGLRIVASIVLDGNC
jgi:hypothetical protein